MSDKQTGSLTRRKRKRREGQSQFVKACSEAAKDMGTVSEEQIVATVRGRKRELQD
jgi:hypothetical protein